MRKQFVSNSRALDYLLLGGLFSLLYAADVLTSGCGNTEGRPQYRAADPKDYDTKNGGFFFDPTKGETVFFLPNSIKRNGKSVPIKWTVINKGGGDVKDSAAGEETQFRLTGFENEKSSSIRLEGRYGDRPEDVIKQQYSVTRR